MKFLYFTFVLLLLAGCASGPRLNTSHPSANHDNRVQFVVVHYTSTNLEQSLALLTHGEVSAHYLIGDDASATIYKLVDESQRAWHAGESEWMGRTWLELQLHRDRKIVNPGYKDTPTGRLWYPYSEAQVKSLVSAAQGHQQAQWHRPQEHHWSQRYSAAAQAGPWAVVSLEAPGR